MPFDWSVFLPSPSEWFYAGIEYEGWGWSSSLVLKVRERADPGEGRPTGRSQHLPSLPPCSRAVCCSLVRRTLVRVGAVDDPGCRRSKEVRTELGKCDRG